MTFQYNLLKWYQQNKRNLPWRKTHNPYNIWLSEIMLQQTQVSTVIDYYLRFLNHYPSFEALSKADEQTVLKLWEGLGYYSRARRLIPCAQMIVKDFNGNFPKKYSDALKLPGVGPYTAGAILSIAYNIKVAAVDGNVKRVYARVYNLTWDISSHKSKKQFKELVEKSLPDNVRDYNQSIMELGALICKPKNPNCLECPIVNHCKSYKNNNHLILPIKSKKIKKSKEDKTIFIIKSNNKILLIKRPSQGLLANLWGFLLEDKVFDTKENIRSFLSSKYSINPTTINYITKTNHVFSHKVWHMTVYFVSTNEMITPQNGHWVSTDDYQDYPIPQAFKKIINYQDLKTL